MKYWEILDHTADFSLRIYGKNIKDLFENAALALMHAMFEQPLKTRNILQEKIIEFDSIDKEALLIDWLRELHYLADVEEEVVQKAEVINLTSTSIKAKIWTRQLKEDDEILNDIKAVTYHNVNLKEGTKQWSVDIVCDM